MGPMTVGQLRGFLEQLPDDAGIIVETRTGEPFYLTCSVVAAFTIGTSTDDPGLVLRAEPVHR